MERYSTQRTMPFDDLTWDDLRDWAGDRVVDRGKSYLRRVEDLRRTADGGLLAWVQGGDRYAVLAKRNDDGDLNSTCTCPYGIACKHAVAVILAYLDRVKNGRRPPRAAADDERMFELVEPANDEHSEDEAANTAHPDDDRVRQHLDGLPKSKLVDMLLEGRNVIPVLRQQLADQAKIKTGNVESLIASTRREIQRISQDQGWTNHWKGTGHIPDWSPACRRLESLLAAGQADAVMDLGGYVLDRGIYQIEHSNDEGETGAEIARAMAIVFKASRTSSWPIARRLLWEFELRMKEGYCILDGLTGPADDFAHGFRAEWSSVADALAKRLEPVPTRPAGARLDFTAKYQREHIMHWLIRALENAGRHKEVIPLLEREVHITYCYERLVDQLLAAGRIEEAQSWAKRGFADTLEQLPGIAWALEERLRKIAEREHNDLLVASYRTLEFFDSPDIVRYTQLEKAASRANVWAAVRDPVLSFLETGQRPDLDVNDGKRGVAALRRKPWPLPPTGLTIRDANARRNPFPDVESLIDIAIKEGRPDDVLKWYRAGHRPAFGHDGTGAKVAQAIQKTHPDEALTIWKELVERELKVANTSAYQTACGYLKKIKGVYELTKRTTEWRTYLASIRQNNSRRPRMMDALNALEGKRTPIVNRASRAIRPAPDHP